MKKNLSVLMLLTAMFAHNANAQGKFEDQLPKSLIVFRNPDVKGVRLNSIVTRVYDNESVQINEGVYLNRMDGFNEDDFKVVFDYPEDGGEPTRRLASGIDDYSIQIPVKYDKVINGLNLSYDKYYTLRIHIEGNVTIVDTIEVNELLGDFPVKEVSLDKGVVTSETNYEYNDNLDMTLRLRKEFDADGNVIGGEKVVVDYKNDYRTEICNNYDTAKKDFVPVRKTVTKSDKWYGWVTEKYIYDADAGGNFDESSYSLVMNVDGVNFSNFIYRDVRGIMTVVEDGVKKVYNVSTDYIFKNADEAEYKTNDYINYSATYKLNDKGEREAAPFKIEREYVTEYINGKAPKFKFVDLLNDRKDEYVSCHVYDSHGFLCTSYSTRIVYYSDANECLKSMEYGGSDDCNIELGSNIEYLYQNRINVGWVRRSDVNPYYHYGCVRAHAYSPYVDRDDICVRDTNYWDVKGADARCPIIYSIVRNYFLFSGVAYAVYYYSSENGTLEPKNPTAITDVTENQEQNVIRIYDVNGTLVRTCTDGKVTLPETHGIYIINNGGKVTKAVL